MNSTRKGMLIGGAAGAVTHVALNSHNGHLGNPVAAAINVGGNAALGGFIGSMHDNANKNRAQVAPMHAKHADTFHGTHARLR